MKWLVVFFLAAITGGGLFFSYTMMEPAHIAFKRADVQLTIAYPDDVPDGSLSKEDITTIENYLARYLGRYKTAVLYINCYPVQKNLSQQKQANFQLVITCNNGCIFESRRTYTSADNLTRIILEKISTGFITMQSTLEQNHTPTKVTY